MFGCIFCQVASHQKPARVVYEDEECLAFHDIHPQAPVHILVIPKKHIGSLNDEFDTEGERILGHLVAVAGRLAKTQGVDQTGFRTIINANAEAGQTVFHIHVHLLGGRIMRWPPG